MVKVVSPSVRLVWATPNPIKVIEEIGRVCYKSEDKMQCECHDGQCRACSARAEKFVRGLVERDHTAMIEHVSASFHIVTDRGVTHEFVRHRIASFAQESTRYCNYGKDKFGNEISVIRPPFDGDDDAEKQWYDDMEYFESCYMTLTQRHKCSPQIARSVLPTCLKTELVITTNAREWRHIMKLRMSEAAHPQIREVCGMIYPILMDWAKPLFDDLKETNNVS